MSSERIVAGASDEGVEAIRALAGHLKALVGVQDVHGCTVAQVRRECAERQLDFQIAWQRIDSVRYLRARRERDNQTCDGGNDLHRFHLNSPQPGCPLPVVIRLRKLPLM